jgi:hypothetical protein
METTIQFDMGAAVLVLVFRTLPKIAASFLSQFEAYVRGRWGGAS